MASEETVQNHAAQLAERTALSKREAEVALQKALAGRDEYKKDIAERIGIDASTLSNHLSSVEEKLDDETVGAAYWQFFSPIDDGMDVRYRDLFRVNDGYGYLTVFENAFHDEDPSGSRFVVVHDHDERSVPEKRGVKRRRYVTDWYQFDTPEQLAEGVLSAVEFDESGMAGGLGRTRFVNEFEDHFGFDPTEVEGAFEFDSFRAGDLPKSHRTLFLPTDTDGDVAAKLSERYDRFAEFFANHDVTDVQFKNPRVKDNATLVAKSYAVDGGLAVLTLDDEVFVIDGDGKCDCGHVNDYSSRRGEPSKSSYQRRRAESCEHKVAALNATDIQRDLSKAEPEPPEDAEHSPCCPVCGYTGVSERRMQNRGEWVMSKFSCALCGEQHGSD